MIACISFLKLDDGLNCEIDEESNESKNNKCSKNCL